MNFKEKKEEMMKKYEAEINLLSKVHNVDLGVAFDMLVANEVSGSNYTYVNHEEFAKDYEELVKAE